jgi:hypothetical protein
MRHLAAIDRSAGSDHGAAIQDAIARRADGDLFRSATRATAAAVRHHLDRALESRADLDTARAIYRAFADFVRQTDPAGFRRLGIAWLELATDGAQCRPEGKSCRTETHHRQFAAPPCRPGQIC